MAETSRHDAWQAGDNYDAYMGRWSRQIAPIFLDWLDAPFGADWLEVGCGTGALSEAILTKCKPKSLISVDASAGFIAAAQARLACDTVEFQVGDAQALTAQTASRDVVVSALVLNFLPDREKAISEMIRVCRRGGQIGFYVWDYPGGGVEFMRAFWNSAVTLDSGAQDLTESKRFPFCTRDGLEAFAKTAGLAQVESSPVEVPTVFKNFDDYWRPFTLGAGPAPGYCANLDPIARQRLMEMLSGELRRQDDGSIALKARAWAVKAIAA